MPFPAAGTEEARELSRQGNEAKNERARLRREDPEGYMRLVLKDETGRLVQLLLDAAYGRETFEWSKDVECPMCEHAFAIPVPSLMPDKRLAAITKALEFAAGKPATQKLEAPKPAEPPKQGLEVV